MRAGELRAALRVSALNAAEISGVGGDGEADEVVALIACERDAASEPPSDKPAATLAPSSEAMK